MLRMVCQLVKNVPTCHSCIRVCYSLSRFTQAADRRPGLWQHYLVGPGSRCTIWYYQHTDNPKSTDDSFMQMLKKRGKIAECWSTPQVRGVMCAISSLPSTNTDWNWLQRKEENHCRMVLPTSNPWSWFKRILSIPLRDQGAPRWMH